MTSPTSTLPVALNDELSVSSFSSFVQHANTFPMLSADDERRYATAWEKEGDIDAARALITSHLRFVIRIARSFSGYGLNMADLVQEGTLGLMKAVKNFKVSRGVRLASFAIHWIKSEMNEFVIRNWRIVKIASTKAQRQLFFNSRLLRKNNDAGRLSAEDVTEISQRLNVSEKDVRTMANRIGNNDTWLGVVEEAGDSNSVDTMLDGEMLRRPQGSSLQQPEEQASQVMGTRLRKNAVQSALAQLDDRSREVLVRRHMTEPKAKLHELANEYDISSERVRQIENAAKRKLKTFLENPKLLPSSELAYDD